MLLRKFYDTAIAEAGGGDTSTITVNEPETYTLAELMAKSGTVNTGNGVSEQEQRTEISNTEKTEEPKTAIEADPVATANGLQPADTAIPESQTPTTEQEAVAETPIAQPTEQNGQSWQEVLKSQQPDTVLKELGYNDTVISLTKDLKEVDPKMLAFLDTWKNNGDVTGYLRELTTDYSTMSNEDVMRHLLREDYPKASEAVLNSLYRQKVINAYSLDPDRFSDEEMEEGRLLLEAEADKHRDKLIEKQKDFLLPKPPEAKAPEPDLQAEREHQEVEAYKATLTNDPYSKAVFATKQIVIGEGENVFKLDVNPEQIKEILTDSEKWRETQFDVIKNPDGSVQSVKPKIETQMLTAAFVANPKKFLDEYAKHFKSLGGKAAIDPIDNAKPPQTNSATRSDAPPASLAEAMAKFGVAT